MPNDEKMSRPTLGLSKPADKSAGDKPIDRDADFIGQPASDGYKIVGGPAPVVPPKSNGEVISVACKLPHGIRLRLFKFREIDIPVLGGGLKTVREAYPLEGEVVLHGFMKNKSAQPHCLVVGNFAITDNVPRDFFIEWMEQNKDHHLVKNGFIFATRRTHDTMKESENRAEMKSGLEQLDPESLPKLSNNPNIADVATDNKAA